MTRSTTLALAKPREDAAEDGPFEYAAPPAIGTRRGGAVLSRVEAYTRHNGEQGAVLTWRQSGGVLTRTSLRAASTRGPSYNEPDLPF